MNHSLEELGGENNDAFDHRALFKQQRYRASLLIPHVHRALVSKRKTIVRERERRVTPDVPSVAVEIVYVCTGGEC